MNLKFHSFRTCFSHSTECLYDPTILLNRMFFFARDFEFVIFMFLDKLLTFYQLHHRLWFRDGFRASCKFPSYCRRDKMNIMQGVINHRSKQFFMMKSHLYIEQSRENIFWNKVISKRKRFSHITGNFILIISEVTFPFQQVRRIANNRASVDSSDGQ